MNTSRTLVLQRISLVQQTSHDVIVRRRCTQRRAIAVAVLAYRGHATNTVSSSLDTIHTKRFATTRCMSHSARRENNHNQQTKALNWLIRPHREKNETRSTTIELGPSSEAIKSSPDLSTSTNKGTFYHEKIILGYSAEQMCDLVGNVQKYKEFLPFCINSEILFEESKSEPKNRINLTLLKKTNAPLKLNQAQQQQPIAQVNISKKEPLKSVEPKSSLVLPPSFKARLEIGYPPIREAYISNVSIIRPYIVKSISRDTRLFEFLINEWKFHPLTTEERFLDHSGGGAGGDDEKQKHSCIVEFYVSFKFRSPLYSRFSSLFMDQIFRKMVNAFTDRALVLYGKPAIESKQLMHSH